MPTTLNFFVLFWDIGSHPLVGIVSNRGILPNLSQGIFDQHQGEFGMSIDIETTDVCLMYSNQEFGWRADKMVTTSLSRRTEEKMLSREKGRASLSSSFGGISIRRSTRLARLAEEQQRLTVERREEEEGGLLTMRSTIEDELVTNEPYNVQFQGATMVHPLRIVIDRLHNKILSFTPTSVIHFEINVPQLSLLAGPVVPVVSFTSGGFRGYSRHSHPAFSPTIEEFLQDYLGLVKKENEESCDGAGSGKSIRTCSYNGTHKPVGSGIERMIMTAIGERRSKLVLYNPLLLDVEYMKLLSPVASPALVEQTSRGTRSREGKSQMFSKRDHNGRVENISKSLNMLEKPDLIQMASLKGTKTLMKLQKTPLHQTSGAPRRQRRATQLPTMCSSNPSPSGEKPSKSMFVSSCNSFLANTYQDLYRVPQTIPTRVPISATSCLSHAFQVARQARRRNSELGLLSRRVRNPKVGRIKKLEQQRVIGSCNNRINQDDIKTLCRSSTVNILGGSIIASGTMPTAQVLSSALVDDCEDDDFLGLGTSPLLQDQCRRKTRCQSRQEEKDIDNWKSSSKQSVTRTKMRKKLKNKCVPKTETKVLFVLIFCPSEFLCRW